MLTMRNWTLGVVVGAICLVAVAGSGFAGESAKYPTKPIELIVPAAAGGGSDLSARFIASQVSKKFGIPVNVINIGGASGVTGMLQALGAAPDGYTMLADTNFVSSFMWASRANLPMKLEDRTFVARATVTPNYFFTNLLTGWKTLGDAMQFLKTKPKEFKWAAGSFGSSPMFNQISLFLAAGVDIATIKQSTMVVFDQGSAPAIQAVLAGDLQFHGSANVESVLSSGRGRVLGANAPERVKWYPDIPTIKEAGFPTSITQWNGISGPKGLPDYVVRAWNDVLRQTLTDREMQAEAPKMRQIWAYLPGPEFKSNVMKENEEAIKIATEAGIRK